MNYKEFKILKFINNCPDLAIPMSTIHNALNIDNNDLEKILTSLMDKDFIYIQNDKYKESNPNYSLTFDGKDYIKRYPLMVFKILFEKYLFPIIVSLVFFILAYIFGK